MSAVLHPSRHFWLQLHHIILNEVKNVGSCTATENLCFWICVSTCLRDGCNVCSLNSADSLEVRFKLNFFKNDLMFLKTWPLFSKFGKDSPPCSSVRRLVNKFIFKNQIHPPHEIMSNLPSFLNDFCVIYRPGCGRKRSDESMAALVDLNSEPAVEELSRQILSEAKLWEALQEARNELINRKHQVGRVPNKYFFESSNNAAKWNAAKCHW